MSTHCHSYLLGCVLVVMITACQSTPRQTGPAGLESLDETERQSYQQALQMLQSDSAEVAERNLARLAEVRTEVPEIWLNLALAHYRQAELVEAKAALTQLFRLREKTQQAHNLAGLIAVQQGEFELARQHYLQAVEIQPEYANALYNLALLHDVYLQQIGPAVDYYRRYVALVPDDQDTRAWLENLELTLSGG